MPRGSLKVGSQSLGHQVQGVVVLARISRPAALPLVGQGGVITTQLASFSSGMRNSYASCGSGRGEIPHKRCGWNLGFRV